MTTRNDVVVTFTTSPRVAEVAEPSTEIIMQDLVDTLRKQEDTFEGMVFKKLINASGKEDLGGGVKVGITVAMQNLLLAFEGRTTPAETGTVTGAPVSPVPSRQIFQDSTATFISNGVQRGSFVVNFTDQSIADVVSVDSETQLTTKVLVEGIGNTYDIADVYKVWNIIQVNASGGNLTAVDEFQAAISSVLPTAFTQVVLTASSSATLQSVDTMEAQISSIHGQIQRAVWVDTSAVSNGSGYQQSPYNNFTDAVDYAEANGLSKIMLLADATLDRQMKNFTFMGVGDPTLDVNNQNIDKSEFYDLHLSGDIGGGVVHAHNCELDGGLNGVQGDFFTCGLSGSVSLLAGGNTTFIDGYSTIGGLSRPSINVGGGGCNVSLRSYRGGLNVTGMDNAGDAVTVSMAQGKLTLLAGNTAGTISIRGLAQFTDNSAGATVDSTGLLNTVDVQLMQDLMEADQFFDQTAGLLHYYYKGTTTDIIPAKTVSGEQVTNNVTLAE